MENFKTLWDKLSQEDKQKLLDEQKRYPHAVTNLIKELKECTILFEMNYMRLDSLLLHLDKASELRSAYYLAAHNIFDNEKDNA